MFCSLAPTHLKFSLSYFLLFTKKFAQFTPIFKNKVLIFHSNACSLPLASSVKIQKVQSSVSTRIPTPTSVSHSCSRQPLMTSSLSNPAVSFQSSTSWPSSCGLALWLAPLISDLNRPSWTPLFGCPPFSLPFCLTPTPGALAEYTILTVFVISEGIWRWQHYQETKATPTHPGHTHLLHDEGCDAPRSWHSSEICLGIDNKDVSIGAIGDPELVAIQDVVIS